MTMTNTTPQTRDFGLLAGIRTLIAGFAQGIALRNDYLRTLDELGRLSDRELDDIGVCRAEIPATARRAARSACATDTVRVQ